VEKETNLVWSNLRLHPFEKTKEGEESKVVLIKDLKQFSTQIANNPRPSIVRIYDKETSQNNMKEIFQSLADDLGKFIFFAAIDTNSSRQLTAILKKILGFSPEQLPMILFFKNGHMILPALSGRVSKKNLFRIIQGKFGMQLIKSGKPFVAQNEVAVKSEQQVFAEEQEEQEEAELGEEKKKESLFKSFVEKLKRVIGVR